MTENHSFGCIEDQIAMGLHDFGLGKSQVYQKSKEMTEQVADLNIQEDVLSLRIENKALREVIIDLEGQVKRGRNIVHRLLVVIQKHKWWSYEVIDEARAYMSEVDRG